MNRTIPHHTVPVRSVLYRTESYRIVYELSVKRRTLSESPLHHKLYYTVGVFVSELP